MMKILAAATVTTLLALAAIADDAPQSDPFRLTLPEGYATFTRQAQTTQSPEGEIETTNWISKAPSGEAVIVTMSRMPGKILDPEKMIASTRDSLVKSLGATLETADPAALFHTSTAWFRATYTVVDDRLFQVLYVGRSAEQRSAAAVESIFRSFALETPAAPAAPAPQS